MIIVNLYFFYFPPFCFNFPHLLPSMKFKWTTKKIGTKIMEIGTNTMEFGTTAVEFDTTTVGFDTTAMQFSTSGVEFSTLVLLMRRKMKLSRRHLYTSSSSAGLIFDQIKFELRCRLVTINIHFIQLLGHVWLYVLEFYLVYCQN